ncbi:hypothetical protein [Agaribacterium sp. ZY112]|uniref:hypothetical protein n=1 Tax=Agaribacterium sp. ZY112 TaxID=3233574 RepID=UPI003523F7D6
MKGAIVSYMKENKSKHQQSEELAQSVQDFLNSGGHVTQVPRGTSGNFDNQNLFKQTHTDEPRSTRTPLTEVVKTLEARKHKPNKPVSTKTKKPRKRLIVDDFGDPIRWVWEE